VARLLPSPARRTFQCVGPGGVVFASCSIALAIQRLGCGTLRITLSVQLISSGRAPVVGGSSAEWGLDTAALTGVAELGGIS
jgi:hypothetical protein